MKENFINAALFIASGTLIYAIFIFVFTIFFDKRMPMPSEFLPLTAVVLTGCAAASMEKETP